MDIDRTKQLAGLGTSHVSTTTNVEGFLEDLARQLRQGKPVVVRIHQVIPGKNMVTYTYLEQ